MGRSLTAWEYVGCGSARVWGAWLSSAYAAKELIIKYGELCLQLPCGLFFEKSPLYLAMIAASPTIDYSLLYQEKNCFWEQLVYPTGCSCMPSHILIPCDPVDCNPPGSSVHGILQATIMEWVVMPSSRGSSWPRNQTCISCVFFIAGGFFTTEPQGKPLSSRIIPYKPSPLTSGQPRHFYRKRRMGVEDTGQFYT